MISDFGKLNGLCKQKAYFWGIKKNSYEDFYRIEVSSHNFDDRPTLWLEKEYIDDALPEMIDFIEGV